MIKTVHTDRAKRTNVGQSNSEDYVHATSIEAETVETTFDKICKLEHGIYGLVEKMRSTCECHSIRFVSTRRRNSYSKYEDFKAPIAVANFKR